MAVTPTLKGKVTNRPGTDQEGLAVSLYTVANYEASGSTTATTTTDSNGRWAFNNVADGVYIVEISNADASEKILFDGSNSVQFDEIDVRSRLIVHRATPSAGFLFYNSADDDNVTGNGAEPTVDFNTEVFDEGSHFTGDTFTASTAARYALATVVQLDGFTGVVGTITLKIQTDNRIYSHAIVYGDEMPTFATVTLSIPAADMDANDAAHVTIKVQGEVSDLVDVLGDASAQSWFSGMMVG